MEGRGSGRPTIDVVVPTLNEARYIERCLDHVLGQDYPAELVTVWLIDSDSTDDTVELARRRFEGARLRMIADAGPRNLPDALNVVLERSSADLVAKIDAHGYPERDYLSRAVELLENAEPDVACVGGTPLQGGETRFARGVALARRSSFGVGGGTYAVKGEHRYTRSVQCGVYRRAALVAVGAFDPEMPYGEDEEVNWRLIQAGHRILLDTRIRFHYSNRPTWLAAFRQYRNYGEARVRVVRKHPGFLRAHHLAPAALVGSLGAAALGATVSLTARRALLAGVSAYAGAALVAASVGTSREDRSLIPVVASGFAALHAGYGVGMLRGMAAVAAGWLGAGAAAGGAARPGGAPAPPFASEYPAAVGQTIPHGAG
jgi:glycosyltransferase involved in cell wall biosynthesis